MIGLDHGFVLEAKNVFLALAAAYLVIGHEIDDVLTRRRRISEEQAGQIPSHRRAHLGVVLAQGDGGLLPGFEWVTSSPIPLALASPAR